MRKNKTDHICGTGMWLNAVGNATNASPGPENKKQTEFFLSRQYVSSNMQMPKKIPQSMY